MLPGLRLICGNILKKKISGFVFLRHRNLKICLSVQPESEKAVEEGRIRYANEMLGYNFTFESEVTEGDKRGRTVGFPTINQHLPDGLIVPKFGVYEKSNGC